MSESTTQSSLLPFVLSPTHSLLLLFGGVLVLYAFRKPNHKLPPGPKGLPIVGNIFQMASPWKKMEQWAQEYGPLVSLNLAGSKLLIINSHDAAKALLDTQGTLYADRPRYIVLCETFLKDLVFPTMNANDRFWRMRRACQELLSKTRVPDYLPVQNREAIVLAHGLLEDPSTWDIQFGRATVSTMVSIVYNIPHLSSLRDPLVHRMRHFFQQVVDSLGAIPMFVECFPWLKYMPSSMAAWKKDAEMAFAFHNKFFIDLYQQVEARINEGDESPCFARTLILEKKRLKLSDPEAIWLAAVPYIAGYATTSNTMRWFILAMIAFPEKQRRCQEELDAVVGRSRMPTFQDKDNLPYIRAAVRELIRWGGILTLGIPHVARGDNFYEGYFIPKGTICVANGWGINRDRAVFGDDADDFNPDRFYKPTRDYIDDGHVSFGFGPRICVGRHIAQNTLFINIATILWAVNISPTVDETGKPRLPATLRPVGSDALARPESLDCSITPRFPEAMDIVTQTKELFH